MEKLIERKLRIKELKKDKSVSLRLNSYIAIKILNKYGSMQKFFDAKIAESKELKILEKLDE